MEIISNEENTFESYDLETQVKRLEFAVGKYEVELFRIQRLIKDNLDKRFHEDVIVREDARNNIVYYKGIEDKIKVELESIRRELNKKRNQMNSNRQDYLVDTIFDLEWLSLLRADLEAQLDDIQMFIDEDNELLEWYRSLENDLALVDDLLPMCESQASSLSRI